MLKSIVAMLTLTLTAATAPAQDIKPVWDLNKDAIDPATIQGQVELVNGAVKLDTTNSFAIPASLLGNQKDYTIEFELKLADNFDILPRREGALRVVSNRDPEAHAGLAVTYMPPEWDPNGGISNRIGLETNTYWNGETTGLNGKNFNKYTIVVKDKLMAVYLNGLLQALTDSINPSSKPLTIGGPGWRGTAFPKPEEIKPIPAPYELRNLRIFDKAIEPADLNPNADIMRNCSGDRYTMQRAIIKDPSLPRILVVGDSISMGYRPFITEHFKGRAYVDYWVGGSFFEFDVKGDDFPALLGWNGVLSQGPYDVVSWNAMTLHMWNGAPGRCTEEKYPVNMTRMVEHLLKTAPKTKFIWIRCTPWRTTPDTGKPTLDPERNDRIIRLNKLTDEIMVKHGIPEIDLYSLCEQKLDTVKTGSKDSVHWNSDVSKLMADQIIAAIEERLPKK